MMELSKHFYLSEFTASRDAAVHGIDNTPNDQQIENLKALATELETVRAVLGGPIIITSGFRCPKLNTLVKGSKTSAHMDGRAADFICPSFGNPKEICLELVTAGVKFDQLIYELGWVHFAIPEAGESWRQDILTAKFSNGVASYVRGIV